MDVLRAVDMDTKLDIGVKSDMQEMVVGDVLEVLAQEDHVLLEDLAMGVADITEVKVTIVEI